MVEIITINSSADISRFGLALEKNSEIDSDIRKVAADIISKVSGNNGQQELLNYTEKFDGKKYSSEELQVTQKEIDEAYNFCSDEIIKALETAKKRIASYHEKQLPEDELYTDEAGVKLGWKWTAIDRVGIYVPGGQAAYPSSVLMNAIPAKVAGVKRLVMVVPAPQGKLNATVLAAAKIAGIDEIYKVGGAQAIAALAYGTNPIPQVNKIVGPGNAYVAAAKAQVFGKVGIDMIAGPSEILVISDNKTNPKWLAADLLSQAEHDKDARSILIVDDKSFAEQVIEEVENTLKIIDRAEIARQSWENNGKIIIVDNFDQAAEVANIIATEHLELAVDNPQELAKKINNAGAIFMGRYTPEAVGDYMAGPSHVLPTSATAKFSSGLGVFDFIKRSSIIDCSQGAFNNIASQTQQIADEEGLGAHALSVSIRLK